jgi:hypothetical protein
LVQCEKRSISLRDDYDIFAGSDPLNPCLRRNVQWSGIFVNFLKEKTLWLANGHAWSGFEKGTATLPSFMQGILRDVEKIKLICFYEQMARNVKCNQKLKVWFMFLMRAFFF